MTNFKHAHQIHEMAPKKPILKLEFHRIILAFSATHGDGLDRWYNMAEVDCMFFLGVC